MRLNSLKAIVKTALRGAAVLLLGAGVASAQQTINLSAGPTTATLPDGNAVPMWGYSCGAVVTTATATCARLNPALTGWSPVLITVPVATSGSTSLTISLTNNLTFGANNIPTSLTIVGQLGGGLGRAARGARACHMHEPRPLHCAIGHVADSRPYDHRHSSGPGKSRAVVLHRSSGGSNDGADLGLAAAGHIPD